jgi:hypothetical protein
MQRREFTRLLALAPLAYMFRSRKPAASQLHCEACGAFVGQVNRPMIVLRKGETYCAEHAGQHPFGHEGSILITGYHFGWEPGYHWSETAGSGIVVSDSLKFA